MGIDWADKSAGYSATEHLDWSNVGLRLVELGEIDVLELIRFRLDIDYVSTGALFTCSLFYLSIHPFKGSSIWTHSPRATPRLTSVPAATCPII